MAIDLLGLCCPREINNPYIPVKCSENKTREICYAKMLFLHCSSENINVYLDKTATLPAIDIALQADINNFHIGDTNTKVLDVPYTRSNDLDIGSNSKSYAKSAEVTRNCNPVVIATYGARDITLTMPLAWDIADVNASGGYLQGEREWANQLNLSPNDWYGFFIACNGDLHPILEAGEFSASAFASFYVSVEEILLPIKNKCNRVMQIDVHFENGYSIGNKIYNLRTDPVTTVLQYDQIMYGIRE